MKVFSLSLIRRARQVLLGNRAIVEAQEKGIVAIQTRQGTKLIHNALSIPSLAQNLLRVAQMNLNGYAFYFKGVDYCIYDGKNELIATLSMVGRTFPLSWNGVKESLSFAKVDKSELWHKRFGHCSYGSLCLIYKEGLAKRLPIIKQPNSVCSYC